MVDTCYFLFELRDKKACPRCFIGSDENQSEQPEKMATGLNFRIQEVITQTCPCNIQLYFMAVKMLIFK